MKRFVAFLLACALCLMVLAGCGGAPVGSAPLSQPGAAADPGAAPAAGAAITLTFGHGQSEAHSFHQAALYFKQLIEERSGGAIAVNVQPNGALGDEKEMAEGLQMGTVDMVVCAVATLTGFDPALDVFNLPYLFESREQGIAVLDGEIGQGMFENLEGQGLKLLGFFDLGFRSMTNSQHPIAAPEDCKGLRMRTLQSNVLVEGLNTFGIDAVSMSFGELFTALQTGAVDGQENPISVIDASRFYEVQKYLSLTEHMYVVLPLLISTKTWEKLSADQQQMLLECAQETVQHQREENLANYGAELADLKANGMEVNEVDKAAFQAAIQPLYDTYAGQFGATVEKIRAVKG